MTRLPWWEQYYDDPSADAFGDPSSEIVQLSEDLKVGGLTLDIGCGEGRNALFLSQQGMHVFAFDTSLSALIKMARRAKTNDLSVSCWQQDLTTFSTSTKFAVVVCHGVLHFFTPTIRNPLIHRIKEFTEPGGYNVIAAFTNDLPAPPDMESLLLGLFAKGGVVEFYSGWEICLRRSYTFRDEHRGGIKHHHAIEKVVARKPAS